MGSKRYSPALRNTDERTRHHAKSIKAVMDSGGDYVDADAHGIALLASLLTEYENIGELDLSDAERLSARIRMSTAITAARKALGLTKSEQRASAASRRGGGRPTKSESEWGDLDV